MSSQRTREINSAITLKKKTPSLLTFQLKNILKSLLKNKKILIISVQEIQRKNDQDNLGGNKKKIKF